MTLLLAECLTLAECEAVIERGMYAFVEVGNALLSIREGKLYRQYRKGITFSEYCKERWKFEDNYARRLISSVEVIDNLKTVPIGTVLPATETQARPLTKLPPSQQAAVWQMAVDSAPKGIVTAKHVETVVRQQKKEAKLSAIAEAQHEIAGGHTLEVRGISDIDLPLASVDMIFTDPPYHDEHLDCYQRLATVAGRVLKPGGFCCVYAGKMFLPQIFSYFSNLDYFWTVAVFHPFSKAKINKLHLFENWRPVLLFRQPGGSNQQLPWVQDVVRGERNKDAHEWQQDIETPELLIDAYSPVGGIVLDPFLGGGTTAVACQQAGRVCIGYDVDPQAIRSTRSRLYECGRTSI